MCLAFMNKCYDGVTSILAVSNRILALMDLATYKFRCMATEWNVLVMKSVLARAMAEVLENVTVGELWIWWLVALLLAMIVTDLSLTPTSSKRTLRKRQSLKRYNR